VKFLFNSFEREFNLEVQEKKKTGRGIFGRKSTRKGGKHIWMSTDNMTNKEIKSMSSEVETKYEIPPIHIFKSWDKSKRKQMLEMWLSAHTTTEIMNALGVKDISYYKRQLGIPGNPKYTGRPKGKQTKKKDEITLIEVKAPAPQIVEPIVIEKAKPKITEFDFSLSGNGSAISLQLEVLKSILTDNEQYSLVITLNKNE